MIDETPMEFDRKETMLAIFLDLSNAFDAMLLQKLNVFSIRGSAFDWPEIYLNGKSRRVVSYGAVFCYTNKTSMEAC